MRKFIYHWELKFSLFVKCNGYICFLGFMLFLLQGFPEILQGVHISPYIVRYLPPFDEFEVDCCNLPRGELAMFPAVPGPSIFVVTLGEGNLSTRSAQRDVIMEGDVIFAPANTEISITAACELRLFRAGVNSSFLQAS